MSQYKIQAENKVGLVLKGSEGKVELKTNITADDFTNVQLSYPEALKIVMAIISIVPDADYDKFMAEDTNFDEEAA